MAERPRPEIDRVREALRRHDEQSADDPEDGSEEEPRAAAEHRDGEERDEPADAETG